MTPNESTILKALAWHALFSFPLTVEEVRLAAPIKLTLAEVETTLGALRAAGRVGERNGLYFLAGHDGDVSERLARYDFAERKYRRARRFSALARFLPFVRGIFACNTLARSGAKVSSDIDLFVAAEDRHVWTARLFTTGLAALLGLRPTFRDATDGVCLSFYVATSALDLRPLALPNDEALPRWIADFYPLYGEAGVVEAFFAQNAWIAATLPNVLTPRAVPRRSLRPRLLPLKRLVESMLSFLEPSARSFQMIIMPPVLKSGGPGIVLTADVIKLHSQDRREEQSRRYRASLVDLDLGS
jgi:hypothetical protein